MTIKKIFFLCFISFILLGTKLGFSQVTVDAGKDTTYCVGLYPTTMYLENATIKNGVEPYSVKWECKEPKGLYSYYTASDFLNDTTLLSPLIVDHISWPKWIKFIVHVTDSENNYAKDSINVRFSTFAYLTGYSVTELEKGDSILFNQSSVGGGIEPLTFRWQPTIGLTNPDRLVTWCKTDSLTEWRTVYDVIATDSCGCVSAPNLMYEIRLHPTGVDELNMVKDNVLNIRKEGTSIYFDNPSKQKARITFYSINGMVLYYLDTNDNYLKVPKLPKNKGIYIIKISIGKLTESSKFINVKI